MRHLLVAFCLAASMFATFGGGSRGQAQEPDKLRDIMRAKLTYSQKILEGIATEDYPAVAANAQKLSLMTLEANWNILTTPDYLQHSMEFRRAADVVRDAAKKENLDGATLGYLQMTLKCVHCHQHVRKVRMALRENLPESSRLADLAPPAPRETPAKQGE